MTFKKKFKNEQQQQNVCPSELTFYTHRGVGALSHSVSRSREMKKKTQNKWRVCESCPAVELSHQRISIAF